MFKKRTDFDLEMVILKRTQLQQIHDEPQELTVYKSLKHFVRGSVTYTFNFPASENDPDIIEADFEDKSVQSKSTGFLANLVGLASSPLVKIANQLGRQGKKGIESAPGSGALQMLRFFVPKKAFEEIFSQIISDMREECFDALQNGDRAKAKWIVWRDHFSLFLAFLAYLATSVGKRVVELWKIGS